MLHHAQVGKLKSSQSYDFTYNRRITNTIGQYVEFNITIENESYTVTLNREAKENGEILMGEIIDFLSILNKKKRQQQLWIDRIWQWADQFDIEEYNVPRNKDDLLNLTHLSFQSISYFKRDKFTELPKEFGNLTKLKFLELGSIVHEEIVLNNLRKLPKEIGNRSSLKTSPPIFTPLPVMLLKALEYHRTIAWKPMRLQPYLTPCQNVTISAEKLPRY